jgi:hypothetical protein
MKEDKVTIGTKVNINIRNLFLSIVLLIEYIKKKIIDRSTTSNIYNPLKENAEYIR